jgi:hypothetical protein
MILGSKKEDITARSRRKVMNSFIDFILMKSARIIISKGNFFFL